MSESAYAELRRGSLRPPMAQDSKSPGHAVAETVLVMPVATKCTGCVARRAGVCQAMPERDLDRLSAAAVPMRLEPGEHFIEEGERPDAFFTLIDGTAKLLKMLPDGRQQITSFAGRGDFLGLAVAQRYSYGAEAVDRVRLCRFSRARLRRLIVDFPALEQRLLEITSHELVLAQEQMLLLGCKNARERLASFLVARAGKAGGGRAAAHAPLPVSLPMTRRDIADYLGLSIETVSRTLTNLRNAGLIAAAPAAGVLIRDLPALAALAAGV